MQFCALATGAKTKSPQASGQKSSWHALCVSSTKGPDNFAGQITKDIMMTHRKFLWPAMLCTAVLVAGCDRTESTTNKDTLGEKVDRAGDQLANDVEQVRHDADRKLDAMEDKIDTGLDKAARKFEESADTARANAAVTGEKLGDKLSDSSLTVKTKSVLIADPDLSALKIEVDTTNGVVTLRGDVASSAAVEKASLVVKAIDGVVGVDNQLRVDPAG
jgi:hyperosmotically inducible periplasmic protein